MRESGLCTCICTCSCTSVTCYVLYDKAIVMLYRPYCTHYLTITCTVTSEGDILYLLSVSQLA